MRLLPQLRYLCGLRRYSLGWVVSYFFRRAGAREQISGGLFSLSQTRNSPQPICLREVTFIPPARRIYPRGQTFISPPEAELSLHRPTSQPPSGNSTINKAVSGSPLFDDQQMGLRGQLLFDDRRIDPREVTFSSVANKWASERQQIGHQG